MATGSLTLNALWIHDASDLAVSTSFGIRSFSEAQSFEGRTSMFAGGRIRATTGPGKQKVYKVELKLTPRQTLEDLEPFMNVPVLLRDQRGRKLYGYIFGLNIGEDMLPGTQTTVPVGSVKFSFEEITMSEEV